jgi:signal recognition particle subunit SRP54
LLKNESGFDDFIPNSANKNMGSMKDLVGMIPGAGKALKDVEKTMLFNTEAMIHSMTPKERSKPSARHEKKTRIKRFWNKIEQVSFKAIRTNEQNDENDARFGGKKI